MVGFLAHNWWVWFILWIVSMLYGMWRDGFLARAWQPFVQMWKEDTPDKTVRQSYQEGAQLGERIAKSKVGEEILLDALLALLASRMFLVMFLASLVLKVIYWT